jgi:hypothetical protein
MKLDRFATSHLPRQQTRSRCIEDFRFGNPGVERIRVDAGIGVDENAFGGQALRAMTGDGAAVVEMTMLAGSDSCSDRK